MIILLTINVGDREESDVEEGDAKTKKHKDRHRRREGRGDAENQTAEGRRYDDAFPTESGR